jgi:hypothetical protein
MAPQRRALLQCRKYLRLLQLVEFLADSRCSVVPGGANARLTRRRERQADVCLRIDVRFRTLIKNRDGDACRAPGSATAVPTGATNAAGAAGAIPLCAAARLSELTGSAAASVTAVRCGDLRIDDRDCRGEYGEAEACSSATSTRPSSSAAAACATTSAAPAAPVASTATLSRASPVTGAAGLGRPAGRSQLTENGARFPVGSGFTGLTIVGSSPHATRSDHSLIVQGSRRT